MLLESLNIPLTDKMPFTTVHVIAWHNLTWDLQTKLSFTGPICYDCVIWECSLYEK